MSKSGHAGKTRAASANATHLARSTIGGGASPDSGTGAEGLTFGIMPDAEQTFYLKQAALCDEAATDATDALEREMHIQARDAWLALAKATDPSLEIARYRFEARR